MNNKNTAANPAFEIQKKHPFGLRTIMELFDVGPMAAITALSVATVVVLVAVFYFVHSAPPSTITISSGPAGSSTQKTALKYAKILERNGVQVNVLTSEGSEQNLRRLADPSSHVDVGIVQGGVTENGGAKVATDQLVSLGSISYQPLMIFYRGKPMELLSELKGKKVSIGPVGSGTRDVALALLALNGIKEGGATTLLDWEAKPAAAALLDKKIDAAFIMSDSASTEIMHNLLRSKQVELYSFKQASAYSRKIDYLNVLDLPEGSIDMGLNIPSHDISLLGPMVELVAVKSLHPALSDLLLEAASEIHGRPGIFQKRGEFPTPIEHAIRISDDANRFYKSGKSLFYRYLPFWLASLVSRVVIVFIPMLVVLIPAMRTIPAFFRWRTTMKIRRRYRELLTVEQDFLAAKDAAEQEALRQHFDRIDDAVNKMRVRAAFADQFYGLRGHIDYVRQLVQGKHG